MSMKVIVVSMKVIEEVFNRFDCSSQLITRVFIRQSIKKI